MPVASKVEDEEIKLTAPEAVPIVPLQKAAGLVPIEDSKKSALEEKAEAFVEDLARLDPSSPEFG